MSDEEKKAIVELNHFSNMTAYWKQEEYTNSEIDNYIKIVLNLIEKQSKEIEELKYKYSDEKIRNTIIKRYREVIEKDYVSKDKIKAKIEEYEQDVKDFEEYWSKDPRKFKKEKSVDYYKLEALKELLEKE